MPFITDFINRQFISHPPVPTASFKGRTVIVTGGSGGLGKEACRHMIRLGASQVIIACRNLEKGEAAAKNLQETISCASNTLQVWHLDMSSYKSVIAFADRVKVALPRLDALLLNAGLRPSKWNITEDNEETITTNVVSLTLLGCLLFPKLRETAMERNTYSHLTVTTSELHEIARFKERNSPSGQLFATLADQNNSSMIDRYNVSKLMDIFIVKQLSSFVAINSNKVIINCVAPGLCQSELSRNYDSTAARLALNILARQTEVGARTIVYGASAGPETHGQYVPDCKITRAGGLCRGQEGEELQNRIWKELQQKLEDIKPGVTSLV